MSYVVKLVGIVLTTLLICLHVKAEETQLKLSLQIDELNRLAIVLENTGSDAIMLRSKLYINVADRNSRLMFYYKSASDDAWEVWERHPSMEPLEIDGGKLQLLPRSSRFVGLGKSSFDSCFLRVELRTLYQTKGVVRVVKLESNTIYIPRLADQ